eukprot:GHVT01065132.1.p1 GENE.GHVT01065132.1~~GHVT01065132.1.p1  ORF type:complete len:656 (+),score=94.96 GHVT01065132.1:1950-3917(+)
MVNVKFKWTDSFHSQVRPALCSMAYEKAAVLFNIAACYAAAGLHADRSTETGSKQAAIAFNKAASVFVLLRDQCASHIIGASSPDLWVVALNMHILQMQAQAQSVVYEAAVGGKLNRSLLSKLACQASAYYSSALSFAKKMKNNLPPDHIAWYRAQELSYLAAAHYQRSIADRPAVEEKSEGYGVLVSRLRMSKGLVKQATELVKEYDLHLNLTTLTGAISKELEQLEKDNAVIYLEVITAPNDLDKLQTQPAFPKIEQIQMQEVVEQSDSALAAFSRLVPTNVRAKADEYSASCSTLSQEVAKVIELKQKEVADFLNDRSLPYAVEAKAQGVPDALWALIQEIQVNGGVDQLETSYESLTQQGLSAAATLKALDERLDDEETTDQQCRQKLQTQWNCAPSHQLNRNFRNSIENYSNKLKQAQLANSALSDKFSRSRLHHDVFKSGMTRELLQARIPSSSASGVDCPRKLKIRTALEKLNTTVDNMNKQQENFKALCTQDNITTDLMKARQYGEAYNDVVERELKKFDGPKATVLDSKGYVDEALREVADAWNDYRALAEASLDSRTETLKGIEASATLLLAALREQQEGRYFFAMLLQYLDTLKQQIDDWLFARRAERQEALQALTGSLATAMNNLDLGSNPSAYPTTSLNKPL